MKNYDVVFPVPTELIWNAFVGAFEGGSTYWLHEANLIEGTKHTRTDLVWWGEEIVFANPFKIEIIYDLENDDGGNGNGNKTIDNSDILIGLCVMAVKYPRHFADLVSENDDSITHDVFMQCVVLGDIIYG